MTNFVRAGAEALAKSPDRELVHLAGDMDTGLRSTIKLGGGKQEVTVVYKDFVLTVDVFALPDEPLCVHLICPKCHHALRISSDRKAIEFDPNRLVNGSRGDISVEPFECTWEMKDAGDHVQGLIAGGITLCRWKAAIDHNVARDA